MAWSMVGDGSIGSPSLHVRSFQLSQSSLSACCSMVSALTRISADCAARILVMAEYFDEIQDVKVTKDMLDLARHIVEQKSGSFEPGKFEDQYETALVDLINQKRAGKPITAKARPRGENVVDLMEALRRSVGGAATESKAAGKPARKSKKASAGQKEMLMPIAGKKPPKEAAAKKPSAKPQRKSA
jgi:DNA end-binding protein Ku